MAKKVVLGATVALAMFVVYVATRPAEFHIQRSGVIHAPAGKIFPYLSQFHLGDKWSPYEKIDPNMKHAYSGTDGTVGAVMEFDGNKDVGAGKLEMLKLVPNELVQIRLTMARPMHGENLVEYRLTPEGDGTRFTWAMTGQSGFVGKLFSVFIDCDKMVGDQFASGIASLKQIAESEGTMSLNEKPESTIFPATDLIFVEKKGTISEIAMSTEQQFHAGLAEVSKQNEVVGRATLFKPGAEAVYRASAMVKAPAGRVPAGFTTGKITGGHYARFTLTGSYDQLPQAWGRVMQLVQELKLSVRDDFFLQVYADEKGPVTYLMVPTKE